MTNDSSRITPSRPPSAVAARIVEARIAAGFENTASAAIRLGVVLGTYKLHESGKHVPKANELRRYAETFGVSYGWLSTGLGRGP